MAPKPALDYSWQDDDDDDELTPLESSDEELDPEPELPTPPLVPKVMEVPTKATRPSIQQATKQNRDRIAAKSSPYLRSPRAISYSVSFFHGIFHIFTFLDKKTNTSFIRNDDIRNYQLGS